MSETKNALEDKSIEEVMGLIADEALTAEEALEIEKQGKNRKTLINLLEKMVQSSETTNEQQPSTLPPKLAEKAIFLVNTKHNKTLYQAGQKEALSQEDFDKLLAAKVIRPLGE